MGVTEAKIKFTMVDAVSQGLADVNSTVQGTTKQFEKLGGALQNMALGAGVAAFGMTIINSAKSWAASVNDLEDKTGMAGESASKLLFIGEAVGLAGEDMAGAFTKMSKSAFAAHDAIVTAKAAGEESDDMYTRLGISVDDSNGKLLDSEQIFQNVAAKHRTMSNGLQKTDMEMAIFGKSGAKLNDMLNLSAEQMQGFIEIAKKMGLIMDSKMSQKWEDATFKGNVLKGALKGLQVQIGNELLPTIEDYTQKLTDAVLWYGTLDDSTKSYMGTAAKAALAIGTLGAGIQAVMFLGQPFANFVAWVNAGMKAMAVQAGITRLAMLGIVGIGLTVATAAVYHGNTLRNHINNGGEVGYDDLGNVHIIEKEPVDVNDPDNFQYAKQLPPTPKTDNGVRDVDTTSSSGAAANKVEQMEARYRKLLEQIKSKITNENGTGLEKGTQSINADLASMAEDVTKINAQGIDTTELTTKMDEYRKVMMDKLIEDQKRTDTLIIENTALTNSTLVDDKKAMAQAEYQITLEELAKEYREKKQSVTNKASADAWYTAQKAAAEKKLSDSTREALMTSYADAIAYAVLTVDLNNATVEESNAEQLNALRKQESYMRETLEFAKLTAEQRLTIEKDLTSNLQAQYKLNAQNLDTAWGEAVRQIKNQTTDFSATMVDAFNSASSGVESALVDMVQGTETVGKSIKNVFSSITDSILEMFVKIAYQQTVLSPLKSIFTSLLSGFGGSSTISASGGSLDMSGGASILGYATGGVASGWSVVGEEGPELVNFSNPGRVYTNSQSGNLLSSQSSAPAVKINITNNTGSAVSAEDTAIKFDGNSYVLDVVINAAQNNVNGFNKSLKTLLGV